MTKVDKFKKKALQLFTTFWLLTFLFRSFSTFPQKDVAILAITTFLGALIYTLFMYLYAKWQDKKNS